MTAWKRVLIGILPLLTAGGGYMAGHKTMENRRPKAREELSITLSGESKPEEGLYLISIRNPTSHMYYFSTSFGFVLGDDSEGFQASYLSAPHGQFISYELLPHVTIDLQAKISAEEGALRYEQGGQILYPSSSDTVRLTGSVTAWELDEGTCRELSFDFPLQTTPLRNFMDEEILLREKEDFLNQCQSIDDLPPLDLPED